MSKRTAFRTRRNATALAVGLGASLALGAGVALADGAVPNGFAGMSALSNESGASLKAQADTQKQAADKEKQAAEKKKADEERASRSQARTVLSADAWVKPVDGYVIGQSFGASGNMWANKHSGQDLVVPTGTPVKAVHKGTVVKAGANGGGDGAAYGNAVVIKHDDNTYSQYAHLSSLAVQVGQTVSTGQQIGLSGSTGNSSGPHLHFEIRTTPDYGTSVEPVAFLGARGGQL
ncbi:M23 family metallopeptidase [Streptomyces sp. AV19]|uniref:M23 family metallopeptidase n=1 Tax=Streptomyces sp. AV19 TaxID=2793068 RepID=UPI0018FED89B|nr:M23 family metallopeptidase [Streptomyces sp. AV19]MBH1934976.1 M23 family metallopeptidase [Streptomyces sp. AV19]MDG4534582.1 M23 family metallopeptidase [Streptomyces sp. AV19]